MTDNIYMRHLEGGLQDSPRMVPLRNLPGTDAIWTSDDTRNAVLFSLAPGALSVCAFASFSKEKNLIEWWNASRKPEWAPQNPIFYGIMDMATVGPLGYASYLVYKHGGGLEYTNTKVALSLYGGSLLCAFLTMPCIRRKNYICLFRNTVLMNLTGIGAAIAFYKIDPTAGMLLVPYALWSTFYTFLTYSMSKMNTSEASERSLI